MSIKTEISEKFASLSSEKEIRAFLNEIITALHDINNATVSSLVKDGAMSEERANNKGAQTDTLLKQIVDNIYENIKNKLQEEESIEKFLDNTRGYAETQCKRVKDLLSNYSKFDKEYQVFVKKQM